MNMCFSAYGQKNKAQVWKIVKVSHKICTLSTDINQSLKFSQTKISDSLFVG